MVIPLMTGAINNREYYLFNSLMSEWETVSLFHNGNIVNNINKEFLSISSI